MAHLELLEILKAFDEWIVEQFGGEEVLVALHDIAIDEVVEDENLFDEEHISFLMCQRLALEELHAEKTKAENARIAREARTAKRQQEKDNPISATLILITPISTILHKSPTIRERGIISKS